MKSIWTLCVVLFAACTLPEEKDRTTPARSADTMRIQSSDSNLASTDIPPVQLPKPVRIRKPSGIYHAHIPFEGSSGINQTVAFYPDYTFRLQEKYSINKKDSTVVTSGTWAPSDGFIWLYKDQIVRARYSWKGDSLFYFSPYYKKSFPLRSATDVMQTSTWKNRQGTTVFAIGNEPFWNIELLQNDTVTLQFADRTELIRLKVKQKLPGADSTVFIAGNDSLQLRLSVYPYFCSDGMSDGVYRNQVRVQLNQQVWNGCGALYK
jgi:uncharacterized membrane protein